MKLTAVIISRNDNYGGHLNERATYAINSAIETYDEVIYVDWNTDTDKKILTSELNIINRTKLKVYTVTPDKVLELTRGERVQPMCEVLSRNIGIRRATGDIIVSTNIDIIAPPREQLDIITSKLRRMELVTVIRKDLELSQVDKVFSKIPFNSENMLRVFGVDPLHTKLMSPFIEVTKHTVDQFPETNHHALASVICGCGDFQIAHAETWHKIKGFEESMKKRQYADTTVQYKVLMEGGIVRASNFPPIYHLNHERDNNPSILNSIVMVKTTQNDETWGFSCERL